MTRRARWTRNWPRLRCLSWQRRRKRNRRARPAPAQQHEHGNGDERDSKAGPEAGEPPARRKAKHSTKRQTEEPVTGKVEQHGDFGFAEAPQDSDGDDLRAVENFKCRYDEQNVRAKPEHMRVVAVDAD